MKFLIFLCLIIFTGCAEYKTTKHDKKETKAYFSSSGFALIYSEDLFKNKIIRKKIKNDTYSVIHDTLKINTPVKIINPVNGKIVDTKITKKTGYPAIFNAVISEKISKDLELNIDNPFIEIIETKKNKTFIAKKSNTFDEERNVAQKAPVDEIKMDELSPKKTKAQKKVSIGFNFIIVVSDFYYLDSANNLKSELLKKTNFKNLFIKKINDKKYRLFVGPFKNFNALKTTYISLNNLGFEGLNIYKE